MKSPPEARSSEKKETTGSKPAGAATTAAPARSGAHINLASAIGNRAFGRALQTKLSVALPGHAHEREAVRVAEWVMRGPARHQPNADRPGPDVGATGGSDPVAARLGAGRPLSRSEQDFFEPRFGANFRSVRLHTGSRAAATSKELSAKAFAFGRHVVFGAGQYAAATAGGRRLLAHELTHVLQQGYAPGASAGRGIVQRVATDPVVPVLPLVVLGAGVGRGRPNNVADVRLIQDRLLALQFLSAADHTAEAPAPGATGSVPEANLAATIAAIEAFQGQVLGHAAPDGAVDAPGNTLTGLNRAIPQPTAAQFAAVAAARGGITPTVTRGVALTAAVGRFPNRDVIAGTVNRPADVTAVQTRLEQIRFLAAGHGEAPAGVPVVAVFALTDDVGRGRPNNAADVRLVQDRLLALGHLSAADHAAEAPAAAAGAIPEANLAATITAIEAFQSESGFSAPDGAVDAGGTTLGFLNTDSVPAGALTRTQEAIRRFQNREVSYWKRRGEVAGAITPRVVRPGDATRALLDRISSHRVRFATGEDIRFRDFPRSGFTVNVEGTSFIGSAAPSALPAAEYTAIGLTPVQTAALRFVSAHEGKFDALNTYDIARVSFGFIQFAGGRGLPPFMALLKSREPAAFASMFQTFGIDVEFNVAGGAIQNPVVVVVDPVTSSILRGRPAEEAIRDSQSLSAVFIRAGRNRDVQRVQVEAATRDYILPSLARQPNYTADIIDVLAAGGGRVTATHVGAAARAFRETPGFAALDAAGRIRRRTPTTSARMDTLLASEQGVAVLMDRSIQEGVGGGFVRLRAAMRWVADQQGLADIAGVSAFEQEVLQQVVDDLTADIAIAGSLDSARTHLRTLWRAAGVAGATVAGVTGQAEAASARSDIDAAIAQLPNKSPGGTRSGLQASLPIQRARMNFAPAPASIADLRTLLNDIRTRLNGNKPNAGNAAAFRGRVRTILAGALAAPGAPAPAPAPAPPP